MVGHWDAKNKEGSKVKVSNHGAALCAVTYKSQQIAVKQCRQKADKRTSRDVLIMKQLNQFQCPNILRLENFKLYPTERTWSCYLEMCPYGDLARLLNKGRQKK
jgi:hypothetical protein